MKIDHLIMELNAAVAEDRPLSDEALLATTDVLMLAIAYNLDKSLSLTVDTAHLIAKALTDLLMRAGIQRKGKS